MKKRTKILIPIFVSIFTLVLVLVLITVAKRPLTRLLPEEEIVSVTRVTTNHSVEEGPVEVEEELAHELIGSFSDLLKDLKYQKRLNLFGDKYVVDDDVSYVITYETYVITVREHGFTLYQNGEYVEGIQFNFLHSKETLEEIEKLF